MPAVVPFVAVAAGVAAAAGLVVVALEVAAGQTAAVPFVVASAVALGVEEQVAYKVEWCCIVGQIAVVGCCSAVGLNTAMVTSVENYMVEVVVS